MGRGYGSLEGWLRVSFDVPVYQGQDRDELAGDYAEWLKGELPLLDRVAATFYPGPAATDGLDGDYTPVWPESAAERRAVSQREADWEERRGRNDY